MPRVLYVLCLHEIQGVASNLKANMTMLLIEDMKLAAFVNMKDIWINIMTLQK